MPLSCNLDWSCAFQALFTQLFMNTIRYFPIAGILFFVIWVWKKDFFSPYRIQLKFPENDKLIYEIKQSFTTLVVFTFIGTTVFLLSKSGIAKTKIYRDFSEHSWTYVISTYIVLLIWHETFFYWVHRLMHSKRFYGLIHSVHHKSVNPSPLAAYNFHYLEAFLEAIYLPIFAYIVPIHYGVLIFHTFQAMLMNIYFHLGYEFYPKGFARNLIFKWINTTTHHNLHHSKFNGNYSLYFNFWDRIMGTNFKNYEEYYDKVIERRESELKLRDSENKKDVIFA
ncbi:MAG: sterol desaturase family protein [Leptospiraceae bacterium]|nr:sterol desaturase family protein [Leptospiraceae bacterium]